MIAYAHTAERVVRRGTESGRQTGREGRTGEPAEEAERCRGGGLAADRARGRGGPGAALNPVVGRILGGCAARGEEEDTDEAYRS